MRHNQPNKTVEDRLQSTFKVAEALEKEDFKVNILLCYDGIPLLQAFKKRKVIKKDGTIKYR